ncbi:MAG TPA: autotransporter-associated beta strand repeat-containing protein [bacterium]|nr:autotransporter-associated beta strand repeat-containing protein [bacterium]
MKTTSSSIRAFLPKLIVGVSLLAAGTALAADKIWSGAAGNNQLGSASNWSPSGVPGNADVAIWDGTVQTTNFYVWSSWGGSGQTAPSILVSNGYTSAITLDPASGGGNLGMSNIVIQAGAGPFSIGDGLGGDATAGTVWRGNSNSAAITEPGLSFGLYNEMVNNSANPATIGSDVALNSGGGSGTRLVAWRGSGNWIVNAPLKLAGSGGLVIAINGSGANTLALNAANSGNMPGNVYINNGTLQLANGDALNTGGTQTIAIDGVNGTKRLALTNGITLNAAMANINITGRNDTTGAANASLYNLGGDNTINGVVRFNAVGGTNLIINAGAGSLTLAGSVTTANVTGNRYFIFEGAGTNIVSGVISNGAATLNVVLNNGVLALNNANTYSGNSIINGGVLTLGNTLAMPNSTAVVNGGTLNVNGGGSISPFIGGLSGAGVVDTLSGGTPTLSVGSNNISSTFSGNITNSTGTVSLQKVGTGTFTLAGASGYSGGTTVVEGTLLVSNTVGSATGSGTVTVQSGTTFGGSGSISGNVNWQAGSAAQFTLNPTTAVSGSNSTPLAIGNFTANANPVTVNLPAGTIAPGTYKLMSYTGTASGALASSVTFVPTQFGLTTAVTTSGGQVLLTVGLAGVAATWTNDVDANWTTAADWSSNPSYPQSPGDAATLGVGSAFRTVTLNANLSVGAMFFTNANSFQVANAGNILTLNNSSAGPASIVVSGGSSNLIGSPVSLSTNLTIATSAGTGLALSNTVSGAKTISITGSGTVTLSGNNTYGPVSGTVGTTLGGGVLALGHNNALAAGDLSVTGSSTVRANTTLSLGNNVIAGTGATATVDNNGNNVTLSGVVSGAGGLAKNGAGTLTLNSANTFSNGVSVNAGTLKLGNVAALPSGTNTGNINIGTNALLDLNGYNVALSGLSSPDASAVVDSSVGGALTLILGENSGFATYLGTIKNSSGSVALVKNGIGTQVLAGTNSVTGTTTINAGTLQIGNGNTNAAITGMAVGLGAGPVANAGNLQINLAGTNVFANQITGTGAVTLASASLNLWLTGNNASWSGPINFFGGNLWVNNTAGLGVGPKTIQPSNPNSTVHLDGSLGNLNIDSSIAFNLSGTPGVLFNEAGSNTISGPVGLVFGNGNPYVVVNGGFLNLAGDVTAINPRILILGGAGNGQISGNYLDSSAGSLTKQDAGTWTLAGAGNTYSGATTVSGGTLIIDGNLNGNGAIAVNGGTMLLNGTDNGTGTATVAAGAAFGGVGTMYSAVTWQAGSTGKFSVSASGETPMTIYNAVTLNNNAITVNVTGGTPLPVGIYTLLNEPNVIYSITGSFTNAPTITGAGLAAGTKAFVTTTTTAVKLTVVNSSVWTLNGNGNWTTGANWDSNPNYPNAAGQLAVLGVGSSLITVNLNASQTIGGISFTNANSFIVTNANNVLTLDNSGNGAQLGVTAGTANAIATGVSLNDTTTVNTAGGTALSVSGNVIGSAGLTVTGNGVLSLTGSNTYSGVTTLSGSTLVLGSTNAIGSGSMTIGSGKLDSSVVNLLNANNNAQNWNGSFTFLGSQNLNLGNGSVTLGNNLTVSVNSNKLVVGGPISGGFTLTYGSTNVVNNGILELDGANDFTGLTLVSGTVALGDDNAFGSAAQIQLSPAALLPTAATNLTIMSKDSTAHTIANGMSLNAFDGPYIFGGTGDLTLSGTIATGNGYKRLFVINKTTISGQVTDNGAPSGQVAKDGLGTLVLTADNTTTKPFRVDAGTLALGSTTAIGSGALTINGGGLDSTVANLVNANNNAQTWGGSFYFAGSENLDMGTGSVTMSANTTITVSNNTLTVGGAITGAARSLTKSGTGTLVLSGANTYSNTTVTAGTLAIAQATLTTNSTVAISNSAVLQLDFNSTNQVAALVLGGVNQAAGVYKAANSGGLITGTGALLVVPLAPAINPNPPVMQVAVSGSTLSLAWPTNAGWILQSNSVGLASSAWFNYPANGSVDVTNVNITVDPAKTNVFFRMVKP